MLVGSGAFFAGLVASSSVPSRAADAVGVTALAGALGLGALAIRAGRRGQWPPLEVVAVMALLIGLARGSAAQAQAPPPWVDAPTSAITARVTAVTGAEQRDRSAVFVGRVDEVVAPREVRAPSGLVQIVAPVLTVATPGEEFEVRGHVTPNDPETPFGRWLARQGVGATMVFPDVRFLGANGTSHLNQPLADVRQRLRGALDRALPQPHAALVSGLVLGDITGMSAAFRDAIRVAGISHLVVASGYNVTLVSATLLSLPRGARRWRLGMQLLGIGVFTLLVGGQPPAVRAALMSIAVLLARHTGRGADQLSVLALTVTVQCLVDPSLSDHLGFQLSVLSTLGLIVLADRLTGRLSRLPRPITEPLATTVAASLMVTPLLVGNFFETSVVAPLTNLLIAPLVPLLSIGGAIAASAAALVPTLGPAIGVALILPAQLGLAIIEVCAAMPFATVAVGNSGPWIAGGGALVVLMAAALGTPEGKSLWEGVRRLPFLRPALLLIGAGGVALVAWLALRPSEPPPLIVWVLDVDHGDAALIRTPGGRTILVDGGPGPAVLRDQLGRRLGLLDQDLAVAILTRIDERRLPGAFAALERYPAALKFAPPGGSTLGLYTRWSTTPGALTIVDTPLVIQPEPGVSIDLYPTRPVPGPGRYDPTPRASLLLRVAYGETAILLGPAATAEATLQAARSDELVANVLVVPRHGDAQSLSPTLLQTVRPTTAVVSVGERNADRLPNRSTLELLGEVPVHRTDLHGTIEIRSDGRAIEVQRDRIPGPR